MLFWALIGIPTAFCTSAILETIYLSWFFFFVINLIKFILNRVSVSHPQVASFLYYQEKMNVFVEPDVHDIFARIPGFGFVQTFYTQDTWYLNFWIYAQQFYFFPIILNMCFIKLLLNISNGSDSVIYTRKLIL